MMVVKIMGWRPWPPLVSEKFGVKLTVKKFVGFDWDPEGAEKENEALAVEIRWKGAKVSFRRTVKRNCTREETLKKVDDQNSALLVEWDEEFQNLCYFSGYNVNVFHPWEVNFTAYHASNQGVKNKISALAEYVHKFMEQETEVEIPLIVTNTTESRNMLCISLRFMEMKAAQEPIEVSQSPAMAFSAASDACFVEKDEVSALKASLRRVKIFTEYVSEES